MMHAEPRYMAVSNATERGTMTMKMQLCDVRAEQAAWACMVGLRDVHIKTGDG
jgi:hypothetical protein